MVPSPVPSWALCPARAPLTLPEEPSWVGAREKTFPHRPPLFPGPRALPLAPGPPDLLGRGGAGRGAVPRKRSPRVAGGAARGRSSSELAAAWPHASRRPRSRSRCHSRCPQPPGSRAGSAQAGEEGPLPGEGGAGPSPGRGLRKQWGRGWKPHRARSSLGPAPQQ